MVKLCFFYIDKIINLSRYRFFIYKNLKIMASKKVKIDAYDLTRGVLLLFIGLFIMILVKDFWYLGLILILLSTTTGVKAIPKKK